MIRFLFLSALVCLSLPLAAQTASLPESEGESAPATVADVVGTWTYAVESPGGGDEGTFTITGEPEAYEGEIVAQGRTLPISNITFDGSTLSFTFAYSDSIFVTMSGEVEDQSLTGSADAGGFGAFPMTASRQPE